MKKNSFNNNIQSEKTDRNFEKKLTNYQDSVITAEREVYRSDLQPFSTHEQEIRQKIGGAFHFFQKSFAKGYLTLIEESKHEMEISGSKGNLLVLAEVNPDKLHLFEDPEGLLKAIEEGNSIYELLGFTEKSLNTFYHTVRTLIENKKFEKAREICYFLVTIAPGVYQFWISLGHCDVNLHSFDSAFYEFSRAMEINPTDPSVYAKIIDLFVELHEFDKAFHFCET
ncbi:MAG TPA: hypothetical protein VGP47_02775, partial [Parachlamydiaceae bacterium]|nr:hypothetical protein [Parachlamydiaceae bacterium]